MVVVVVAMVSKRATSTMAVYIAGFVRTGNDD